jgi:FixJ family two-component response regulator
LSNVSEGIADGSGRPTLPIQTVHIVDEDANARSAFNELLRARGFSTALYETRRSFLGAVPPLLGNCIVFDVRVDNDGVIRDLMQILKSKTAAPVIAMSR